MTQRCDVLIVGSAPAAVAGGGAGERALAEWIVDGRCCCLDLSPLGWSRVLRNEPLRELYVV